MSSLCFDLSAAHAFRLISALTAVFCLLAEPDCAAQFEARDAALSQGRNSSERGEFAKIIAPFDSITDKFESFLRIGTSFHGEDEVPNARAQFEMALHVVGISEEQVARARVKIAETHVVEMNYEVANALLVDVLGSKAVSLESKVDAHLLVAKIFSNYGGVAAWAKVRDACAEVIALDAASEKARLAAHSAIVPALLALREFPKARMSLEVLVGEASIPIKERLGFKIELARTLWLERQFSQARSELTQARAMVDEAGLVGEPRQAACAEIQLLVGLTFYDDSDFERAKTELMQVLSMPGQTHTQKPWREANLRLRLRNLIPAEEPELKVFFIGSSHTLLGNVPLLVEQIAASAPKGTPRIVSGDHARMGTGMRAHWMQGDAPDTPRGKIAAEPWDAIVVEAFYRTTREDLAEFGDAYAKLVRRQGARLVVYESPVLKSLPYPDGFVAFHASNIWLGRQLGIAIAPSVLAWMKFFGDSPEEQKLRELYKDGIHATSKGAYLTSCCLYSALTGLSAEGLWFPSEMSGEEALQFQQMAWRAFVETREAIQNPTQSR